MVTRIGFVNFLLEALFMIGISSIFSFDLEIRVKLILMYFFIQNLMGRYRGRSLLMYDEIRLILLSDFGFFISSFLIIPIQGLWIREIIDIGILSFGMTVFSLFCSRYSHILLRKYFKHNVMIIGAGKTAMEISDVCKGNRFSLMDVRCFINCNNSGYLENVNQNILIEGDNVYPLKRMEEIIDKEKIDTVMIAIPEMEHDDMKKLTRRIANKVDVVKYLPQVSGLVTFDTKVEDFDGVLMISSSHGQIKFISRVFKRLIDICGALCGLIILAPLTIYVYYRNRKEGDTDPIFFTQNRIGKDGKEFKLYKFRTMVPNAEKVLEELMEKDPKIKEEYLTNKKLANDPRITAAGKMLREKSFDEFPQFINVLKGEMSLIGPRPYLPREKEDMGDYYNSVIACVPGLTGMWQSHGRSEVGFHQRLELDDYYYRNWSFWLDVTLLSKTIRQVIYGEGAM